MPAIVLVTRLSGSLEECFELSLSVDAHTESMSRSGERAVAGVTAGVMALGDEVTWRAHHFGVPFTMTSRISEYEFPHRFVDEQVSGPFKRWWHEHRFETVDGMTQMTDTAVFDSPAGPVGDLVNVLGLTRYMTRLLERRNKWLVAAVANPDHPTH